MKTEKRETSFDRGTTTYRPYFKRTAGRQTLFADPSVFFIPPHKIF
ncbi:MAG: hypothetical protein WBP57_11620 [Ignavibacteria bacterium]|nr:hypothetical protein [Ignavibacteriales bacterium]